MIGIVLYIINTACSVFNKNNLISINWFFVSLGLDSLLGALASKYKAKTHNGTIAIVCSTQIVASVLFYILFLFYIFCVMLSLDTMSPIV